MHTQEDSNTSELIKAADASHCHVSLPQRQFLGFIAEVDRQEAWQDSGARDMAHWVCMRYGVSYWKALRWIKAAPRSGKASLDLEGVRLGGAGDRQGGGAHPVRHSRDRGAPDCVGPGSVLRAHQGEGDLLHRSLQEAQEAEQARSLSWWYFQENSRFGLSAELPAADGAVVARPWSAWPIISPRCPARIVRLRQLKYRDRECTFPGCGERRFTQAHHIVWWECGGPTDLDNLVLVCTFHHKLVHEYGWAIKREQHGTVSWFRPDGTGYRAGPGPPPTISEREPALSAAAR